MFPHEKAAFINAQTEMMINERQIMLSENEERANQGHGPANGPEQWANWHRNWENILGYNALIAFFNS
jgi:hypothetical protein